MHLLPGSVNDLVDSAIHSLLKRPGDVAQIRVSARRSFAFKHSYAVLAVFVVVFDFLVHVVCVGVKIEGEERALGLAWGHDGQMGSERFYIMVVECLDGPEGRIG